MYSINCIKVRLEGTSTLLARAPRSYKSCLLTTLADHHRGTLFFECSCSWRERDLEGMHHSESGGARLNVVSTRLTKQWTFRYMYLSRGRNWIPRSDQLKITDLYTPTLSLTLQNTEDIKLANINSGKILQEKVSGQFEVSYLQWMLQSNGTCYSPLRRTSQAFFLIHQLQTALWCFQTTHWITAKKALGYDVTNF